MSAIDIPWRLVIVESPFTPQTPLPEGGCTCVRACPRHLPRGNCPWTGCHPCAGQAWEVRFGCLFDQIVKTRTKESDRNAHYLAACLADCVRRGESPYAGHGLLVLDGTKPEEHARGISAGFAWRRAAAATVFYTDLGWSSEMGAGLEHAKMLGRQQVETLVSDFEDHSTVHRIEERQLGEGWDK